MKNHDEFRKAVFEKAEEYKKQKQLKKQRMLKVTVSSFACAAIVALGSVMPIKMLVSNRNTMDTVHTVSATCATTCSTSTTAGTSSEIKDYTSTVVANTEIIETTETTETTTATTVVTTTATTLATTRKENAVPDEYYYNGALVLQFSNSCGVEETKITEARAVNSLLELSEKEQKYYDERFFEANSLIILKGTTLGTNTPPILAGIQFSEGKAQVFLDMPKDFDEDSIIGAEWQMLIPVSKTLISENMEIFIDKE